MILSFKRLLFVYPGCSEPHNLDHFLSIYCPKMPRKCSQTLGQIGQIILMHDMVPKMCQNPPPKTLAVCWPSLQHPYLDATFAPGLLQCTRRSVSPTLPSRSWGHFRRTNGGYTWLNEFLNFLEHNDNVTPSHAAGPSQHFCSISWANILSKSLSISWYA